jgi:hypothetical protein
MGKQTSDKADAETVETVQKLIELALDDANEEESRTAAVKAVQMMKKHDLHIISGEDMRKAETLIGEARDLAKASKDDNRKNMLIGAALGYFFGGGKGL